ARFVFDEPSSTDSANDRRQAQRSPESGSLAYWSKIRARIRVRSISLRLTVFRRARAHGSFARCRREKVSPGKRCRATQNVRRDCPKMLRLRPLFLPLRGSARPRPAGAAIRPDRRWLRAQTGEFLTP